MGAVVRRRRVLNDSARRVPTGDPASAGVDDGMSDPRDDGRTDEDRDISDVGLAHAGDDVRTDAAAGGTSDADEAALDEVSPAEEGQG